MIKIGRRTWTTSLLGGASLLLVSACGGSSSHTSNADACRALVPDLRQVGTAFATITTKPKDFPATEAKLGKALTADVENVGNGDLKPAVADFVGHLDNVAKTLSAGKPAAAADAAAFGVDATKINSVCTAAGVPATSN